MADLDEEPGDQRVFRVRREVAGVVQHHGEGTFQATDRVGVEGGRRLELRAAQDTARSRELPSVARAALVGLGGAY